MTILFNVKKIQACYQLITGIPLHNIKPAGQMRAKQFSDVFERSTDERLECASATIVDYHDAFPRVSGNANYLAPSYYVDKQ